MPCRRRDPRLAADRYDGPGVRPSPPTNHEPRPMIDGRSLRAARWPINDVRLHRGAGVRPAINDSSRRRHPCELIGTGLFGPTGATATVGKRQRTLRLRTTRPETPLPAAPARSAGGTSSNKACLPFINSDYGFQSYDLMINRLLFPLQRHVF